MRPSALTTTSSFRLDRSVVLQPQPVHYSYCHLLFCCVMFVYRSSRLRGKCTCPTGSACYNKISCDPAHVVTYFVGSIKQRTYLTEYLIRDSCALNGQVANAFVVAAGEHVPRPKMFRGWRQWQRSACTSVWVPSRKRPDTEHPLSPPILEIHVHCVSKRPTPSSPWAAKHLAKMLPSHAERRCARHYCLQISHTKNTLG
jgi:hypothetical protein